MQLYLITAIIYRITIYTTAGSRPHLKLEKPASGGQEEQREAGQTGARCAVEKACESRNRFAFGGP